MIKRIDGLTYGDLDKALRGLGFEVTENGDRTYFDPRSGGRVSFPKFSLSEPLAAYHFVAARGFLDNFGIVDRNDFDLLLIRQTGVTMPALV